MSSTAQMFSDVIRVADTSDIGRARRAVAEAAAPEIGADRVHDVQLVVSELVTNALEHGDQTHVEVDFGAVDGHYVVSVRSTSDSVPAANPEAVPGDRPAGRGLQIVEAIADETSIQSDGRTTTVICRFARSSAA